MCINDMCDVRVTPPDPKDGIVYICILIVILLAGIYIALHTI